MSNQQLSSATQAFVALQTQIQALIAEFDNVATVAEAEAAANKLLTAQVLSQISQGSSLADALTAALFGVQGALNPVSFRANRPVETLTPNITHIEHSWVLSGSASNYIRVDPANDERFEVLADGYYLFRLRADFSGANYPETYRLIKNGAEETFFTTAHGGSLMGLAPAVNGDRLSFGRSFSALLGQPAPPSTTSSPSDIIFLKVA